MEYRSIETHRLTGSPRYHPTGTWREFRHPGGSLGCTDFLVALYFSVMKHEHYCETIFDGRFAGESVLPLNNGHISPLFGVWHDPAISLQELGTFRKIVCRSGRTKGFRVLHGFRIPSARA